MIQFFYGAHSGYNADDHGTGIYVCNDRPTVFIHGQEIVSSQVSGIQNLAYVSDVAGITDTGKPANAAGAIEFTNADGSKGYIYIPYVKAKKDASTTDGVAGLMSKEDKAKLDSVEEATIESIKALLQKGELLTVAAADEKFATKADASAASTAAGEAKTAANKAQADVNAVNQKVTDGEILTKGSVKKGDNALKIDGSGKLYVETPKTSEVVGSGLIDASTVENKTTVSFKLNAADNVLSAGANGLETVIGLKYDSGAKTISLTGKNDAVIGKPIDATPFIVDGMLESVEVTEQDGTKGLKFTWNIDGETTGVKKTSFVSLADFKATTYTAGKHIAISETNEISVTGMDTAKTVTTEDILVGGGVADSSLFPGGKIPMGTSLQEILTQLLCKEEYPATVSTPGTASITTSISGGVLDHNGEKVEVGTKVNLSEITAMAAEWTKVESKVTGITYGYADDAAGTNKSTATSIEKNWAAPVKTANASVTVTYNGLNSAAAPDAGESITAQTGLTVGEGTNTVQINVKSEAYKISCEGIGSKYVCSNIGHFSEDHKTTAIEAITDRVVPAVEKSESRTVTGERHWFLGAKPSAIELTSANIRALSNNVAPTADEITLSIAEGTKAVYVVVPVGKTLKEVADVNAMGTPITESFKSEGSVQVEGANDFAAAEYTAYVYRPSAALGANTYKITIA